MKHYEREFPNVQFAPAPGDDAVEPGEEARLNEVIDACNQGTLRQELLRLVEAPEADYLMVMLPLGHLQLVLSLLLGANQYIHAARQVQDN